MSTREQETVTPDRNGGQQPAVQSVLSVSTQSYDYDIPENFLNLDELAAPSPVANAHEAPLYWQDYLENRRSQHHVTESQRHEDLETSGPAIDGLSLSQAPELSEPGSSARQGVRASKLAVELYTTSYLIFFSLWGVLARLGLQELTAYPGSPLSFSELWANVGGSLIMGFLHEDRQLFNMYEMNEHHESHQVPQNVSTESQETVTTTPPADTRANNDPEKEMLESRKALATMKKSIPIYIGLATGFCGSFTSYSSFMRDTFLELANLAPAVIPGGSPTALALPSRNGGYSFMAVLCVLSITVGMCLAALKLGAHIAISLERVRIPLPTIITSKKFDICVVVVSWGLWLGAIIMTVWPPDRPGGPAASANATWTQESWRGRVLFSLVFAPLGCLLRFYLSLYMNRIIASFPLGTFTANMLGILVLGMCWDLQHAPLGDFSESVGGGRLGCQILQGVQDGFCGCLTTVSTWVLELTGLRRRHAYIYGGLSIIIGLALLVLLMGSLVWSSGISDPVCSA